MAIKLKDIDDRPKEPFAPADEPTAAGDPTQLADSSAPSLTRTFKALVARNTEGLAPLRPTLARLAELVERFQSNGHAEIGVEFATFDSLRELNLLKRTGAEPMQFSILTVYDAKFLIRLYPDCKIDCYRDNLSKPLPLQVLDTDEFWYKTERSSGGTVKVLKNEPRFDRYDLKNSDDELKFMSCIIETAAACAALSSMRELDLPASRDSTPAKPLTAAKMPKP